ncbi:MAG: YceI family protein, partial [Pseudomonadota bacterium]
QAEVVINRLDFGIGAKHHVVNRDAVLARMVPGVRPRAPHAAARVYIGRSGAGRTLAAFLVGAISMGGVAAILAYDRAPIVQVAATTTPSAPLPTGKAQLWSVVEDESRLGFSGTQMGAGFDGEFTAFKALIEFDPERLDASEVVVVIDLASATTGDPVNDGTLVGGDWLAVSDHPKGTFTATEFVAGEAPGSYTAKGALTLRGIEKPFELPFALQIEGERARMQAEVVINRLDFGIGAKPDPAGATISLEIPVKVDLTAVKATPTPAPATGAGG